MDGLATINGFVLLILGIFDFPACHRLFISSRARATSLYLPPLQRMKNV
jgi:hypothetical protein